jgi:hypothetical protein
METMKNILLIVLTIASISCHGQEQKSDKYVVTYQKDGKTVTDTVAIQDTTLQNELHQMMNDPNYKPRKPQNDTIFNSKGNPVQVKLDDDIFGAIVQRFEYDSTNNLIRITGYDNHNNVKPFYHDIAIQINKYDQNGNLLEIRNLGEDEQLIPSEFEDTPIIRMKYNNKGQLIEKWFLDENENLRPEFSIIKFNYDVEGNRITKGWFNDKGEKK